VLAQTPPLFGFAKNPLPHPTRKPPPAAKFRQRSPIGDQRRALRVCGWRKPPEQPQEAFGVAEPTAKRWSP